MSSSKNTPFVNPFETNTPTQIQQPVKNLTPKKPNLAKKILKGFTAFILVILLLLGITAGIAYIKIYKPALALYSEAQKLQSMQTEIKTAISSRNLQTIKSVLDKTKTQKDVVYEKYKYFSFLKTVPKIKDYYDDGEQLFSISQESFDTADIVLKAIEPYQDFLGVTGGTNSLDTKTTEDRITFLTQTVEGIVPYFDTIEQKIGAIETSLDKIDPNRYPENFRGVPIRASLSQAKNLLSEVHQFVKDGKPILTKTSYLLGKDKPVTYLLLFQNNAELRPTGGFWTAYGLLKVDKGKITPIASDDIYALDAKLNSKIPAPRPIKAYHINVDTWYLRDMNISPDFPTAAKLFTEQYDKVSKDKYDVIVGITTKPVVDLISVLGRIGVPGWGNFTPDPDKRCDGCPNVLYQMLWLAGKPRNYIDTNRKGFLGPLMHSVLSNAMGSPKEKMGPLVQSMLTDISEKHILFYFKDEAIQEAAVKANIAGSITQTDQNTDYFHLNDANMSSAKTNLFLTQKIRHEIIKEGDTIKHKVTVTYTNPSKASNCNLEKGDICLNAPKYRDWFRFFVPTGSTLEKMTGSEVDPLTYEELGKTVFEGFYGNKYPLYAQSSTKTSVQYTSSVKASDKYRLLLQKQPGTKPIEYQLVVNGVEQEPFTWTTDKIITPAW